VTDFGNGEPLLRKIGMTGIKQFGGITDTIDSVRSDVRRMLRISGKRSVKLPPPRDCKGDESQRSATGFSRNWEGRP
jgi:hypothetical protein